MHIRPNLITWSVADYCNAFNRGEIQIDRKYQRNAKVWPSRAQSYLIETILRGFPMPKLTLHQKTDLRSRKTLKFVVDGQQRTNAIVDFFRGNFTLSKTLELTEARGKKLDGLSSELQEAFLSYPLQFDQFEAADEHVVREYFRRINSFTTPLNPEERRHASYEGNMKWLVLKMSERHTETLVSLKTISEGQVVRMADHKLFAEVIHALLNGITTTSSSTLDRMYRTYDIAEIPSSDNLQKSIDSAFDRIIGWRDLCSTALVHRSYIFYSLVLAVIAIESDWAKLLSTDDRNGGGLCEASEQNLLAVADALMNESEGQPFADMVKASSEKTNTRENRQIRVDALARALVNAI